MKYGINVIALIALLSSSTIACAHSYPDHCEPRVGETVNIAPTKVKIWFTVDLMATGSTIVVTDSDGKQVDSKDTHLDEKDKTLLSVSTRKLSPGIYTVSWHAVSHDTHKTKGDYKFVVKT